MPNFPEWPRRRQRCSSLSACSRATDLVAVHGIEPEKFRRFRKIDIPEEQYRAFSQERGAAIVGEKVARTYVISATTFGFSMLSMKTAFTLSLLIVLMSSAIFFEEGSFWVLTPSIGIDL